MKKIGLIAFIITLTVGMVIASIFSFGKITGNLFSFGEGVKGSGNVVTEQRDLADFNSVDVGGAFKLEIVAQKDFNVEVEGDDNLLPFVRIVVEGDTLKIDTERRISPKTPLIIRISAPNIESIEASGAVKIDVTNINNDLLSIDASGASQIKAEGTTKQLNADLSGASRLEADNLRADDATVDASGACHVNVFALNDLNVEASGACKIYYSGNPKNLKKDVSGASCVREQ